MAKVTFDGDNKIIQVNTNIVELLFEEDVYEEWKIWALDNLNYTQAIHKTGGDTIVTNQLFLPKAFILLNGWKIRPYEGQHILNIKSNVYTYDNSLIYVSNGFDVEVNISNEECTSSSNNGLNMDQDQKLTDIFDKMCELWRLNGLDINNPVYITPTSRNTLDISQTFTCDSETGEITTTRN